MKLKTAILLALLCLTATTARAEGNILKGHKFGDWKVDFGIEERQRWEYSTDFDFNEAKEDDGHLFFNRVLLSSRFSLEKSIEVFIEGLDARVGNHQRKKLTTQVDDFDLHQAYVGFNNILDSKFSAKLGRQKIQYGKGRIVAAPTWANRVNSFDAVVVKFADAPLSVDVLGGWNVKYDDNNANHINDEEILNGVYLGYQKDKKSPLLEVYSLNLIDNNKKASGHISRYNIGARVAGALWKGFTYDFEAPYQFGEKGDLDIKAYALHLDLNQSFEKAWKPKFTLELNLATGDDSSTDNESNTFVPLFQSTHGPYGIMDFFRWQNMREVAGLLQVSPVKKLQFTGELHFFWLDNTHDSWYNSSGTAVKSGTTADVSSYVGSEASLWAKYDLTKEIQLESGYSHFFTGSYVKDRGAHDDADWVYSQITLKF